jgi:prophage regulatory protein
MLSVSARTLPRGGLFFGVNILAELNTLTSRPQILRSPAVQSLTGLSRSTLYRIIAKNEFPQPLTLGVRAVGWLESAVTAWIDSRTSTKNGVLK